MPRARPPAPRPGLRRGLSLIETLVGLAVGLLVVLAVLMLTLRMSSSRAEIDRTNRQVENGRWALARMAEDLRHAGYYGEFGSPTAPLAATLAINPCSTGAANLTSLLSLPAYGLPDVALAARPSCITTAADFVAGSSVLVLRFLSPVVTAPASLDASLMYVQSTVAGTIIAQGNVSPPLDTFTLTRPTGAMPLPAGEIRRLVVRMYFLSPCSRPAPGQASCTAAADDGRPVPTLKMVELDGSGGAPAWTAPRAVAEGIERFAIDWGIDDDGDGAADRLSRCAGATCTAADWGNLVSAELHVLARETEPTSGHTDTKTYTLGLAGDVTPGGAFRRQLYRTTARLNNLSMRRE